MGPSGTQAPGRSGTGPAVLLGIVADGLPISRGAHTIDIRCTADSSSANVGGRLEQSVMMRLQAS
jgi:hypothetical protein